MNMNEIDAKYIDLHLHSFYSDGKEPPAEVVDRADHYGLKLIALTDHDGMGGVAEAVSAGNAKGIKVIPGCEFSSVHKAELGGFEHKNYYMHILGYGMNPGNGKLKECLDYINFRRVRRNEKLMEVFERLGYPMTMDELQAHSVNGFVGKVSFARVLVDRGICKDVPEVFASTDFLKHPDIKAVHRYKISAQEAIDVIHEAGGKAFFAHPFQLSYKSDHEESEEEYRNMIALVVEDLKNNGLDGIEAYYPTHSDDQVNWVLGLADRLELLVSKGSDDHGKNARPVRRMMSFQTKADSARFDWLGEYL